VRSPTPERGAVAFQIVVKVRQTDGDIYSPKLERQEAEEHLNRIRRDLGTSERPDVPWLAVIGEDIVSANIIESEY
jgi:hypothetical protein